MSRILDILENIRNGTPYTGEALSRIEAILKSLCNGSTNLVNVKDFQADNLLVPVDITRLKGKTISISCIVNNSKISGTGGRLRLDIIDNGEITNEFGNIISGGVVDVSKIENFSLSPTASKVILNFQSFTASSGFSSFEKVMINEGETASAYTEFVVEAQSRHEMLLQAIKNGETVEIIPRTRVEEILIAIANKTALPKDYFSELERAYAEILGAMFNE